MATLAAGNYWAKVKPDGTITGESATKKTPQVEIGVIVTHTAVNGEWQPLDKPEERTVFLSLSDGAWQYTERKLDALGFNGDFGNPVFKPEVYDGLELVCELETYEGKTKEKWELGKWGGREATPAGADVVRRLNALWKSARGSSKPAGQPAAPPPPKAAVKPVPPPPAPRSAPSPAPAAAATATVELVATTRDEAWAYICKACEGNPKMDATEKWGAAWAEVAKDRHEDELTEIDWARIAEIGSLPF